MKNSDVVQRKYDQDGDIGFEMDAKDWEGELWVSWEKEI
jgi:hypothetical protein